MPPSESDLERWRELHAFYVQRLRAQGVENVIVADIPGYGQDLSVLAEKDFADPLADSCNVLFGFHAYGALGDFAAHENAIQKVQVKNYLVMVGEFGVAYPVEAGNAGLPEDNVTGFEAMRVLGPKYGIGVLWWHAVGDNTRPSTRLNETGAASGRATTAATSPLTGRSFRI